jgi:hypothetical protein
MIRFHVVVATVVCLLTAGAGRARAQSAAAAPVDQSALPFSYNGPPPPIPPETITRDAQGRATIRAVKLAMPLRLDGKLDEAAYEEVPSISGFIQTEPVFGQPATQDTEFWILYDDKNLYISTRCWEDHPEKMVLNEMRRDASNIGQNERIGITIDTFYDRRNGATFSVTALGGRSDGQITDERIYNSDWNPVWDVAAGRFDGGWTLEIAIPFKSLKYRPGRNQIWGFQIGRLNRWKNESDYLTPMPPALATRGLFQISLAPTLVGLEVPEGAKNLEIKPYAISNSTTDQLARPVIANNVTSNAGVDVKYGVTQNLTGDFTYRTDFAQVEADEQQVNLTRFNLFFPEKRDFFLENQGTFGFGGATASFGSTTTTSDTPVLFYSRRVGLNGSTVVPIEVGGRLTGRMSRYSIGVLGIRADEEAATHALPTAFSAFRLKRDILRRSSVGVIFTDRSISQIAPGRNRAYGVDGTFAFFNNLAITTFWAKTETPGIAAQDTSYRGLLDYAGDRYGVQVERLVVDPHFNPEIGFVRRTDIARNYALFRFSPRPRTKSRVRKYTYQGSLTYIENRAGHVTERDRELDYGIEFQNGDKFAANYVGTYEFIPVPFHIASNVTVPVGGYDYGGGLVGYTLGSQRRLSGTFQIQHGSFYDGHKTSYTISSGRLNIRPQFAIEPGLSLNKVDLVEGSFTSTVLSSRLTYTMTTRMFASALLQYVSSTNTFAVNARFRWEYQPGSEFFVVYNEQRDTFAPGFPGLNNRSFIVKVNRLFRF